MAENRLLAAIRKANAVVGDALTSPPSVETDPLYRNFGKPLEDFVAKRTEGLPDGKIKTLLRQMAGLNPLHSVGAVGPGGLVGGIKGPKYPTYHGHAQSHPFREVDPSRLGAHRGNQFLDSFFHTARRPELARLFSQWGKKGREGQRGAPTVEVFKLPEGEYLDFHNPRYTAYPEDYERLLATFRAKFGDRGERILAETQLGREFRPNHNTVRSRPAHDGESPFSPFIEAINDDPQLLTEAGFKGLRYDNRYQLTADPNFMPGMDQVSWAVAPEHVGAIQHVDRYYMDRKGNLQKAIVGRRK